MELKKETQKYHKFKRKRAKFHKLETKPSYPDANTTQKEKKN